MENYIAAKFIIFIVVIIVMIVSYIFESKDAATMNPSGWHLQYVDNTDTLYQGD